MRRTITLLSALALGVGTAGLTAASAGTSAGAASTYLVLFSGSSSPSDAATLITRAGGSVVANYDQIGVAVAKSSSDRFAPSLRTDRRVEGVAATTGLGINPFGSETSAEDGEAAPGDLPNAPATDGDSLSGLQWDMRQIHTPEAHEITGGSPTVLVGDIDTGLDFSHPDLAPNYDAANSADCTSGARTALQPGNDVNGHGTHTAGTIAAAANGIGIVGVAPKVRIAGIKAGNDDGYFFPEAVICAFMWAGSRHMDVTNNSYFADPWLYNCRNNAEQRAIWKAEQRAIRYAMNQGVTVVSAAGNESDDLSHPTIDKTSPDYPAGSEQQRDVTNACVVIPVEIPGVIGVSADGHNQQSNGGWLKSFYSSYGTSAVDVVAPGGDSRFGVNAEATNGRVLSTYPATTPCTRKFDVATGDPNYPTARYCYLQGTSMASPHVAGLAALVISRYGDLSNPSNGKMRPGAVEAAIQQTADPQPCPDTLPATYGATTQTDGSPQTCQGGTGHNSWYGNGQVNALAAVTR